MKYGHRDIRNVLERSSARETTARVAVAGVAKRLLGEFGITILSHVTEIGGIRIGPLEIAVGRGRSARRGQRGPLRRSRRRARHDRGHRPGQGRPATPWAGSSRWLPSAARWASAPTCSGTGSSTGGSPAPSAPSTRSRAPRSAWASRPRAARAPRSTTRSSSTATAASIARSNSAGGLEGGVTNGQPVVVRAAMKPISTLRKPLRSVDLATKEAVEAVVERSDVCAVPGRRCGRRGHDGASCSPRRSSRSSAATASTRSAATTRATSTTSKSW